MADLNAVKTAARRVERLETKLEEARRSLEAQVAAANDAGASYSQIGDALGGLSKARIGEMANAARAGVTPYDLRRERA